MLLKLTKLLVILVFGFVTIQVFKTFNYQSLSYLLSSLIINPVLFVIGTISFTVTVIGLTSFVKAMIKQTYDWMVRKEKPDISIFIVNYSSLACILFLFSQSVLISSILVGVTFIYGMMTVELKREHEKYLSEREGDL